MAWLEVELSFCAFHVLQAVSMWIGRNKQTLQAKKSWLSWRSMTNFVTKLLHVDHVFDHYTILTRLDTLLVPRGLVNSIHGLQDTSGSPEKRDSSRPSQEAEQSPNHLCILIIVPGSSQSSTIVGFSREIKMQ
jgi:hypothetical protein